ncbi:type III glutamate--ammonia ligase [Mycolicibacterium novocastrense]|uniref:Glutamine synthetase n=1 Tax=Mycolicibacterium novocastrense TaxID=59813 RepID=A0AAW5SRH5_MYCNV|nr:type III glutamate--ammonia ligase [Mycolicibacterium novocastrense]MCV7026106.1 type III glutamate--ammonia ligase [Mycolicibacterium novocastrense]GAT08880.1 glutamine synthetase [Mycolicibacterium novocastrense]
MSKDLATLAEESGTTFILALFVDLRGKPCAKLVPVEAVELLATDGVGFAGYAVGAMGQEPKDPDMMAIPDVESFTPIPFIKDGLAIVHCDPHVEGAPWPYAPRVILKALIEQAADAGFEPWVGAEVEYFLLRRTTDGGLCTADAADTAAQPCYDARGVTRMYDHLTAISRAMNQLGWSNYANDHEDGNGQFEQNFEFADALTTADRVVTLRYLLSTIAAERGMVATFMPKPFADRTGSGLHLHVSLTSAGRPVFPAGPDEPDEHGLGLSETAYAFLGGILEHACALQAVVAPTVNSYKRTRATTTASGASWSPNTPSYGGNDRTHYIRVPDAQRIELRGSDGSANPYLAIAAALGAGLDGIKRSTDPGPVAAQHRSPLPATLLHAVDELESDPVVAGVLDATGDGVASYFANLKRDEFFAYHSAVTTWEIDNYLTAF